VGYTIAYNAEVSDLLTEDDAIIRSQGLRTVQDPFLSEYKAEDLSELRQKRARKISCTRRLRRRTWPKGRIFVPDVKQSA
jgi:hypothetical protein